jgi:hypothetical protein
LIADRVKKWFAARVEKAAGTYFEGQEPPERLKDQVVAWANMHPLATRKEWADFAAGMAREAWSAAYLRGVEWAEREPAEERDGPTPEQIADAADPEWRWGPAVDLYAPGAAVLEERTEPERIESIFAALGPRARRF